jgi:hypothetical protein
MLAFILKVDHPATADSETPLDPRRKLAAWLTIGIFFLTFMPVPLTVVEPPATMRELGPNRRPGERSPASPWNFESPQDEDEPSDDRPVTNVRWQLPDAPRVRLASGSTA